MPVSETTELDEYGPPVAKVAKYSHFPHEERTSQETSFPAYETLIPPTELPSRQQAPHNVTPPDLELIPTHNHSGLDLSAATKIEQIENFAVDKMFPNGHHQHNLFNSYSHYAFPHQWNPQFPTSQENVFSTQSYTFPSAYPQDIGTLSAQARIGDKEECPACGTSFVRETGKPDPKTGNMLCPACSPRTWEASSVGSTGHPSLLTNSRNKREKQNKKCPNCQTTTTSLWRKFKTADEVKKTIQKKKPSVSIDRSRPEIEGQLGCNACTLYWSLHGRHRPLELARPDAPLTQRKRKRTKKPEDSPKYPLNSFSFGNHWGSNYPFWPNAGGMNYPSLPHGSLFGPQAAAINQMYSTPIPNDYMKHGTLESFNSISGSSPGSSGSSPLGGGAMTAVLPPAGLPDQTGAIVSPDVKPPLCI